MSKKKAQDPKEIVVEQVEEVVAEASEADEAAETAERTASPMEDTAYKTQTEGAETMNEKTNENNEKKHSWIPGFDAGKELVNQFVAPWFDATVTTLEQVQNLNQRLFDRTQDAIKESFDFFSEGVRQLNHITNRTHKVLQDQLRRFGSQGQA